MLESKFKSDLKKEIARRLPHVKIYETSTNRRNRPDLIVLGPWRWAALELKREEDATRQPNQERHMNELGEMGLSCFTHPDNAEEVLRGLEELFSPF